MTERYYLERHFQLDFGKWARHNLTQTAALELKVSKTDSLPFNRLEDHQFSALKAAKGSAGVYHKIADGTMGRKPFDCFYIANSAALVVVMFNCTLIGNKTFYLIDIDQWEQEATGDRRSLTEDRARVIGRVARLA